jgi:hypothetical protein
VCVCVCVCACACACACVCVLCFEIFSRNVLQYFVNNSIDSSVELLLQGLYMLMDASSQSDMLILEPYIDVLLNTLFAQISQPVDYRVPASIKNHNELLRCFAVLGKTCLVVACECSK